VTEITFERYTGRTSGAGKGLIADYYQTILGQVNKEKRRFFANDRILVNVTIDRSHRQDEIGRFAREFSAALGVSLRPSALRILLTQRAAEIRRGPQS